MTIDAAAGEQRGGGHGRKDPEHAGEAGASTARTRQRVADEVRLAELVRAERSRAAELTAIIGAIGEGIVVISGSGQVSHSNRTARRMLGSLEGSNLEEILARFARPEDVRVKLGRAPVQARLADDGQRWLEVSSYAVDDSPGAGNDGGGIILVLRDVTEARERDHARDAFIGVLSHELRTPITTIYAGSKLLAREKALPEETRSSIFDDIQSEAERLHRLVEDVVALTRFGEGALEVGNDPVLLQRVVPAVARSEEGRWPGRPIEVKLESDLPPVAGDATYIEQVVRNFVVNAMKYGRPGAPVVIDAKANPEEVEVRVIDDGPGFPEEEAPRLFQLYYRSAAVSNKVSGSGIGLFVCARLIDAMGGRIWAANRPEGGAEFGFALRAMAEER